MTKISLHWFYLSLHYVKFDKAPAYGENRIQAFYFGKR